MLASLIASFASGETLLALRRARMAAMAYALAGVAFLCGAGFLVAAFYIWAARRYGGIEAALGFGVGFLVLGAIVLMVHKITTGSRAKRAAQRRSSDMTTIAVASALAVLPTILRGKAGLGTLAAPAVAAIAYAIYRENRPKRPSREPLDED
ncbi:hypothetical protein EET67_11460 [Pseudaminobacter arsenicus]|uniref:Phage holin family protein n=1 Tax=Borborobacter arsenicus TaxID=1851146 RepID=A0A432V667_9HYPH|nr:hypothetical protein [Pseudaminobacter arsenicus]RUM97676.1 hypothetical protein EET67_11460 [Pseudaminobacter arsenicus]